MWGCISFFMDTGQTCVTDPAARSEISVLGLDLRYSAALLALVSSIRAALTAEVTACNVWGRGDAG